MCETYRTLLDESRLQLLKRERVLRRIHATSEEARSDVTDYIGLFYNTHRRHGVNDRLSRVEYEQQYQNRLTRT